LITSPLHVKHGKCYSHLISSTRRVQGSQSLLEATSRQDLHMAQRKKSEEIGS
jgi:hypothetical protein